MKGPVIHIDLSDKTNLQSKKPDARVNSKNVISCDSGLTIASKKKTTIFVQKLKELPLRTQ